MKTLVMVCGASHSGTTLLDLMLGNAPDAFSCGEVSARFRPYRSHHFEIDCPCGRTPCPYWEKIKDSSEREFHRRVIEQLEVNYVIDSSKEIAWVLDSNIWAKRNHLQVINLLIWKDIVDLAYSYWKRGWEITTAWHNFVKYHKKFLELSLPFLSISYRDLIQSPTNSLKRICMVIGMPYFEGKERFWEKQHHHLFGSGGVRTQVEKGKSTIRNHFDYPSRFRADMDVFRGRIEQDVETQKILKILRQSNVFLSVSSSLSEKTLRPSSIFQLRPCWYYKERFQRAIKRYFPDPWSPVNPKTGKG